MAEYVVGRLADKPSVLFGPFDTTAAAQEFADTWRRETPFAMTAEVLSLAAEQPVGNEVARQQLADYRERYGREPRLGCDLSAHRDLGFCGACQDPTDELLAWRLLAMAERGVPPQPWQKGSTGG